MDGRRMCSGMCSGAWTGWRAEPAVASVGLWLGPMLLALAALLPAGCGGDSQAQGPRERPPLRVQVLTASAETLPRELEAVGTLQNPEQTLVAAEVAGRVTEVDIPQGRAVEAGRVLARLNDAQARAAVKAARARLENARQHRERLGALRQSSVSSEQAYEDAVARFVGASADLEAAEKMLADTVIRAPLSGVLGLVTVAPGQFLEVGDAVAELTPIGGLEVHFAVPQGQIRQVIAGQPVFAALDGDCGAAFRGEVSAIEPKVDPATRTVMVKALLGAADPALLPGMAVRVRLRVGEIPGAILVPQEAVIRQGTEYRVFVIGSESEAVSRGVRLGRFFGDRVHVTSGLKDGDRVVVTGHQKLRPGAKAELSPYEPLQNPTLDLARSPSDCAG